ncbi:MAG: hypothetical protein J6Y02_16500 [Pseudobutyrivibrio sp.]|nr:hypothetical protein [Pseudobutyrivibrio sp.]
MLFLQYLGDENRYEVNLRSISTNVLEVIGDFPHMDGGFYIHMDPINENKPIDNTMYKTIYREFDDRCQFSNDGTIWIQPTRNVVINAEFENHYDCPDSVEVTVKNHGEVVRVIELTRDNAYSYIFTNVPVETTFTLEPAYVDNYMSIVADMTITYYKINHSADMMAELDESITDTQVGLAETYEQVETNTNDILDCQLALAEIYEMIVNGGE